MSSQWDREEFRGREELHGICWMFGLYKHTLNVPVDHYLENIQIPSSYIPIRQKIQRNMFSIQGQRLWEWPTWSISSVTENIWVADLDLLRTLAMLGGDWLQRVARLVVKP